MTNFIFDIFLILQLTSLSGALYCYQCGDGRNDGPCQEDLEEMAKDHAKHLDSSQNYTDLDFTYRKQCPDSEPTCVIERVQVNGVIVAYIRDCSDGVNFSINASRFMNFSPDKNITTCSYVEGKFFTCVSLCNSDLCNGPQTDSNTSSASKVTLLWTAMFSVAMCLLF
ncbi:uncharacterized protein LOC111132983 [Crassostrea virginica]